MKISELIERLGEIQGEYGDVQVAVYWCGTCMRVMEVKSQEHFGMWPHDKDVVQLAVIKGA